MTNLKKIIRFGARVSYRVDIIENNYYDFKTIFGIIIFSKIFVPYWFTKKVTRYSLIAIGKNIN